MHTVDVKCVSVISCGVLTLKSTPSGNSLFYAEVQSSDHDVLRIVFKHETDLSP